MKTKPKTNFVGRSEEQAKLAKIGNLNEASVLIVYGRRRVGKTELLERAYQDRGIIKFEGLENQPSATQIEHCLSLLAGYTQNSVIQKVRCSQWTEFFEILSPYLTKGRWTLYFEELQWLANYETSFLAALKYAWDNHLRHNPQLLVVLCGSSPSFMVSQVIQSRALYNRSQHVLHLKEFLLPEARDFLKTKSEREVLDALLSVGGVPEYLKWLKKESSVFLGLCKNSFEAEGFFATECDRIFTSSLARNKNYKAIVDFLSTRRFATRNEIAKHLGREAGGTLTDLLNDLELSGLVERYVPFNLGEKSLLARYAICDAYLQFYFKFISPIEKRITQGDFNRNPVSALSMDHYQKWMGFAFERWCRRHHSLFARILGFEAVRYKVGAFYNREAQKSSPGYQIDLAFDRDDRVLTLCEIKYLNAPVETNVIQDFERKISLIPFVNTRSLYKVLIAPDGASSALQARHYFDRVVTLQDIFNKKYWD